jgi:RNA polymerase sigma-70 factor, ECF subfamily
MTDRLGSPQSLAVEPAARPVESVETPNFRAVYEAHFGYVWASLRRIGVHEADLEDLCHDVFVAFYKCLASYDPARPLKPWLFGIAFRVASDHRRRARHRFEVPAAADVADRAPAADERVAERQAQQLVREALAVLDDDKRAVFILHEIDGQSMPEIAVVIEAPINTLYSRLRLARAEFAAEVRRLRGLK